MLRNVLYFILTLFIVISASAVSSRLWAGKEELQPENIAVTVSEDMTVAEFGKKHDLDRKVLKKVFNLTSPDDLKKPVADFGINEELLSKKVNQVQAIQAENESKNWFKILLKGLLWIVFLLAVFNLIRKGRITARNRKWIYMAAVGVFGVILGSDPSPMGTVKDAIVLLGSKGMIFPPRLIAFGIFLLMVILANKFICSWGCQLGTLQDLIFRFNRDSKDSKGLFYQVKIPFIVSNSIRILFFLVLILVAFFWSADIIGSIDPFKIFKPQAIGMAGGLFIGLILVLSLFVYRPWCHFFCPFGLVGWLAEKVSFFKIKVDYDKCISCQACSKACPSTVMDAILKQDRVIPDCFSCGTCIKTCPVNAISFERGKRQKPPAGKFDNEVTSD
jgi:NAD-dependent dihydropyrimidine dehydrogenase PreA subunit